MASISVAPLFLLSGCTSPAPALRAEGREVVACWDDEVGSRGSSKCWLTPSSQSYKPGDLPLSYEAPNWTDIRRVEAFRTSGGLEFVITFAEPIPSPVPGWMWLQFRPYLEIKEPHEPLVLTVAVLGGSYGSEPPIGTGRAAVVALRYADYPRGRGRPEAARIGPARLELAGEVVRVTVPLVEADEPWSRPYRRMRDSRGLRDSEAPMDLHVFYVPPDAAFEQDVVVDPYDSLWEPSGGMNWGPLAGSRAHPPLPQLR